MARRSLVESEFARSLILRRCRSRSAPRPSRAADRDDYVQELSLRLLVAERKYDRRIAPAEAFILVVVERDLADLKRRSRRGRLLIDPISNRDDREDRRDEHLAVDLALDVAAILAVIPEPLRTTANHLKLVSKAEAARNLGVSSQCMKNRVRDLRKAFEKYRFRHS